MIKGAIWINLKVSWVKSLSESLVNWLKNFSKDLMLNKDNIAPDNPERDEQVFYIPRINHAGAGKRAAILSYGLSGSGSR